MELRNVIKESWKLSPNYNFFILIFTALLIQTTGRYYSELLKIGPFFYLSWVILRFVIPILVINFLHIPVGALGLGKPLVKKKYIIIILFGIFFLLVAFFILSFFGTYFGHYSNHFFAHNKLQRITNFLIFTSSTLTGWEFLHRSFLLMGCFYLLRKNMHIAEGVATLTCVSIVMVFEVGYHLIKPPVETFAFLIGSPMLSLLVIKTRSIWISFMLHFIVEIGFIFSLVFR